MLVLVASVPPAPARAQDVGDFTADFRGAKVAQLSGWAKSWGSEEEQGWYVQLWMPDGTTILLLYSGGVRPPEGTYKVADFIASDATPPAGGFIATVSTPTDILGASGFNSTKGTVMITKSTRDEVEGTFSFEARKTVSPTGMAELDGSFRSTNEEG